MEVVAVRVVREVVRWWLGGGEEVLVWVGCGEAGKGRGGEGGRTSCGLALGGCRGRGSRGRRFGGCRGRG